MGAKWESCERDYSFPVERAMFSKALQGCHGLSVSHSKQKTNITLAFEALGSLPQLTVVLLGIDQPQFSGTWETQIGSRGFPRNQLFSEKLWMTISFS